MVPVPIALFKASPSAVEVIVIAAKKPGTIWPLEPHTEAKHIILRRYLLAWVPILTSWNGRVVYIDGFAGPGVYTGGEDGSPIIALKAAIEHSARISGETHFIFIEAHPERFDVLKQRVDDVARPANFKVSCERGRFDETMTSLLDDLERERASLAPTFAFVDPFGFSHTPISLIERIMTYPRCEVLITFMYEEINRFLSHADQPENYDQLFGTAEWRRAVEIEVPRERKVFLHDLYRAQLRERCRIEHVRSFEMRNDGNRTDYFLFFGTNSVAGLKKMKEAMWKVDESSGLQFSDATDPSQEVLFAREPSFPDLKRRRRWSKQIRPSLRSYPPRPRGGNAALATIRWGLSSASCRAMGGGAQGNDLHVPDRRRHCRDDPRMRKCSPNLLTRRMRAPGRKWRWQREDEGAGRNEWRSIGGRASRAGGAARVRRSCHAPGKELDLSDAGRAQRAVLHHELQEHFVPRTGSSSLNRCR